MTKIPEQIINQQILAWSQQQAMREREDAQPTFWPIITVSREFGARGAALAARLGERTGFKVWDKDIINAIAEQGGGAVRVLKSLDEHRRRYIEDAVSGTLMGRRYTNLHYVRSLMHVVHTLAAHGKNIVVGRGANFICKADQAFHVRVVCPLEQRVQGYAERQEISLQKARKIIEKRDADRTDFIQRTFKKDVAAPSNYDLVLNAGTYSLDQLADIVFVAYEIKTGLRLQELNSVTCP